MNWIKQFKILASIAIIAILGFLGLGWLAFSSMSATSKSVAKYKTAAGELSKLYTGQLFPTNENLASKKKFVTELKTETSTLRDALAEQYGAKSTEDPATFGQRVQRKYEDLKKAWDEKGFKVPDDFFLGMDKYRERIAAPKESIVHLEHQLEAIGFVMQSAVDAGLESLVVFERQPVTGEDGAKAPESDEKKPARGEEVSASPIIHRYNLKVQCKGSESAVQSWVNSLAASQSHFFAFNAIRTQNEQLVGPDREKVREAVQAQAPVAAEVNIFAAAAEAPSSIFGESAPAPAPGGAPGAAPAAAAAEFAFTQPGTKDAYLFLGGEKVNVLLSMDLVIFEPNPTKDATN